MQTPVFFRQSLPIAILAFLFLAASPRHLNAQAAPAAQRGSEMTAFGMLSRGNPDFGGHVNTGVAFGADYMRYLRWWVNPSLEFRAKILPGPTVRQTTYGVGLRGEHTIRQFHPYGDFLVSYGDITFYNPTFNPIRTESSESSLVYSYGGGVDVDVIKQWAARVDFQSEHWNIGKTAGGQDITLTPFLWSIGAVYRFEFGRQK
jgi:hypothetical protein